MRCIRSYFGVETTELAGRVIDPSYQRQGLGSALLARYIADVRPERLVTYTRNAAVIRMLGHVSTQVYPIVSRPDLQQFALHVATDTTTIEGVTYQLQRYGEEGLFKGFDPADRSYDATKISMKQRFIGLQSIRSALVVVADLGEGEV